MAIGVVCALVIVIGAWIQTPRDGTFARDLMAALDEQKRGFWYCFLRDRVIPVLTIFLIMLVWPLAVVMGIQNLLERRRKIRPPLKR
jgi:hypothetical protein